MKSLIDTNGQICFGFYPAPIDNLNYMDFRLQTAMGLTVPAVFKKLLFNQFNFIGISGPDLIIGMAIVDLKYVTNGFLYVYDRRSNILTETGRVAFPSEKASIDSTPETPDSAFCHKKLSIRLKNGIIQASMENINIDVRLNLQQTSPLRLCSKSGYNGWTYTQKTSPICLTGHISIGNRKIRLSSPQYMGLMDWTGGFMRRHTFWNWAATACTLPDGRPFGLNLSCGVNETSFTENAFWINGTMTKINLVNFIFDSKNLHKAWHILSNDKKVDLRFYPETHRSEKLNAWLIKSRFTQLLGVFEGVVITDDGERIELHQCPGWVEDHYSKW